MGSAAWAGAVYGAASLAAFLLHALDKAAAVRGGRRVPERTLHLVELLGGWPGGLLASALLRHKTRRVGFLLVRGATILLHAVAWALVLGGGAPS
ncbi:MAG: DUF1294 domain-containing protein [Planctomycetes bacterium]|nr:DUF1294 domain-containing protein [Planctomycetota bacterium]